MVRSEAGWWPALLPFSPALLILPFPGLFRFTCYYYRGAYYKAFWADPPACAVGEPRKSYLGENSFPLILQNIHRYFLYVALIFIFLLAYDVWMALWFADPATGQQRVRHRRRHARPGRQRRAARRLHLRLPLGAARGRRAQGRGLEVAGLRLARYDCVSSLNGRHMLFAWCSLFSVGVRRRLRAALLDGDLDRSEDLSDGGATQPTPTTCWSSAPAAPGCARRSKRRTPASRSA